MVLRDVTDLVKRIKNKECTEIAKENVGCFDVKRKVESGADLVLSSKSVEKCLLVKDIVSYLLDFDIYCLSWENIEKSIKSILSYQYAKVNTITFIIQDPLIDLFEEVMMLLEKVKSIGILVERINVFVPYSSETHVEYTKLMGILKYEYKNRCIVNFDFKSMKELMQSEEKWDAAVEIQQLSLKDLYYCNGDMLFNNKAVSTVFTCTEYANLLNPILEFDLDDIYDKVTIERKNNNQHYVMPKLFSVDSVRNNINNLLCIDNLPYDLKMRCSRHTIQLITFIFQEFDFSSLKNANVSLFSVGQTSKMISTAFYNSYNEILRKMNKNNPESGEKTDYNDITVLIMDRTMDLISPIYSPIKNMNLNEDMIFTRFDDGIIEYMDDLINRNLEYVQVGDNNNINDKTSKHQVPESECDEEMSEVTNPIYLSIILDPDKLQKDLLLSESFPVLSYKFISSLEDLEKLMKSGEREFTYTQKKSIISRISSLFKTNTKLFSDNSWLYLLSNIAQSSYIRSFWNQLLELQYNTYINNAVEKRVLFLNMIRGILDHIYNTEIILNRNDGATYFNISDIGRDEKEFNIINDIISLLLKIRAKLLPDSVTNVLSKFDNYDKSVFENSEMCNLSLDASLFLSTMHIFMLQILPIEQVNSYNSIFVKELKKKFTSSSFENILSNNGEYYSGKNNSYNNKILSLAISCCSYEGPDCKLSQYNNNAIGNDAGSLELSKKIKLKLNNIRNSRSILNNKKYRNFQLSSLLPSKNDNLSQELLTLVSQLLLPIIQSDSQSTTLNDNFYSDFNPVNIEKNNSKNNKKTVIVNIIGNVSIYEILEIEKLSTILKESNSDNECNIIILTDQLFSPTAFNNYFI